MTSADSEITPQRLHRLPLNLDRHLLHALLHSNRRHNQRRHHRRRRNALLRARRRPRQYLRSHRQRRRLVRLRRLSQIHNRNNRPAVRLDHVTPHDNLRLPNHAGTGGAIVDPACGAGVYFAVRIPIFSSQSGVYIFVGDR